MKGRLRDLTYSRNNSQILEVEITDDDIGYLFDEYSGKEIELSISLPKTRRSKDANAYAWVLLGKLALKLRQPKELVYRDLIRRIGGNYEVLEMNSEAVSKFREIWSAKGSGWVCEVLDQTEYRTEVAAYYGSSVYDTRQMSALIDEIITECRLNGIETITPKEKEELLAAWEARYGSRP